MLALASYLSSSPAVRRNLLCIFTSSTALAFQVKHKMQSAQDRPEPKHNFSPRTQVNWHSLPLLILVTGQTIREDRCPGTLPEHGSMAHLCHLCFKKCLLINE